MLAAFWPLIPIIAICLRSAVLGAGRSCCIVPAFSISSNRIPCRDFLRAIPARRRRLLEGGKVAYLDIICLEVLHLELALLMYWGTMFEGLELGM